LGGRWWHEQQFVDSSAASVSAAYLTEQWTTEPVRVGETLHRFAKGGFVDFKFFGQFGAARGRGAGVSAVIGEGEQDQSLHLA
jgi:hypothetical protein